MPTKRKACPNLVDTGKQKKAGRPSTEYTTHDAVKLVLDNRLKYHLAINALCLQGSLTKQRLQYFVSLERERRRSRGDMVVPSAISTKRKGHDEEDSTLLTETSPLTTATNESKTSTNTTNSSECWKRKSTSRSPRR
ncbi:hypothetical protein MHU86_8843 [Fragilaria crotonensis]|nr:hypothetical protein MHU86_8843 [Fragilaria crotonensis]